MKRFFKIFGISVAATVLVFALFLGALNLLKFAIYSEYYAMESEICKNPGISDAFICQGIAAVENEGVILVSGYMKDGTRSRIYVTDYDGNSYFVELTRGDKDYTGHAGGIATFGDRVYISNASKLFIASLDDILNAERGGTVYIGNGVRVNCAASFVYADDDYVYVGEFNSPEEKTQKSHPYETPSGKNHAIITRYSHDDLEHPDKIYSIGDYAQGVCFTPDGRIIISTSHGMADSVYYVYIESEATDSGNTLNGAPVYFLGECKKAVRGPAMAEGLDWLSGEVITLSESASDKYIFGKFFFADDIVSLDFDLEK